MPDTPPSAEQVALIHALVHALRTPLSGARVNLQLLMRQAEDVERVRFLAARLGGDHARLERQLNDLVEYVQPMPAGPLTAVAMGDCLSSVLAANATFISREGLQIEVLGDRQVKADRALLESVLERLLQGAARGGATRVQVTCSAEGLIWEEDSPPPPTPDALFQPFDQSRGGLGLAYPLARRGAEAMGGTLSAEVRANKLQLSLCLLPA